MSISTWKAGNKEWRNLGLALCAAAAVLTSSLAGAAISARENTDFGASAALMPTHPAETTKAERHYITATEAYQAGDMLKAIHWWRLAAYEGHTLSQYNLGSAYASGVGVPINMIEATSWWRMAALQGSTDAQYNLGVIYYEGESVTRNVSEAAMWWYMAAMGGDPAAQFRLGYLAATGEGSEVDVNDARVWWQRAADQGFELAARALELLNNGDVIRKADRE